MSVTQLVKRRRIRTCAIGVAILAAAACAQTASTGAASAASMKQLMLDLIHPSSNDILLAISRSPKDDREWAAVRHSALTLAESGNILLMRGPANAPEWRKDVQLLVDAGNAAYKAAQAKNTAALAESGTSLDASCTTCHKQYRPNVYPKEGASK